MITDHTIAIWRMAAKDDNWHRIFVASDIREMVGEIERLREENRKLREMLLDELAKPEVNEQQAESK
jgi:regulator of replication initiation timing